MHRVLVRGISSALLAATLGSGVALTAAATNDPTALLRSLRTTPISTSALPANFASPTFSKVPLSPNSIQHHAVGILSFDFAASGANVLFEVFPTHQDAVADYRATPGNTGDTHTPAPGFLPAPSEINSGTLGPGAGGISGVLFVDGNVLIDAVTTSLASRHGDIPTAIKLARFARAQLVAARR